IRAGRSRALHCRCGAWWRFSITTGTNVSAPPSATRLWISTTRMARRRTRTTAVIMVWQTCSFIRRRTRWSAVSCSGDGAKTSWTVSRPTIFASSFPLSTTFPRRSHFDVRAVGPRGPGGGERVYVEKDDTSKDAHCSVYGDDVRHGAVVSAGPKDQPRRAGQGASGGGRTRSIREI